MRETVKKIIQTIKFFLGGESEIMSQIEIPSEEPLSYEQVSDLIEKKLGKLELSDFKSRIQVRYNNYKGIGYDDTTAQKLAASEVMKYKRYTKESIEEKQKLKKGMYSVEFMRFIVAYKKRGNRSVAPPQKKISSTIARHQLINIGRKDNER